MVLVISSYPSCRFYAAIPRRPSPDAASHIVVQHVPPLALIVTQSPTLARDIRTREYPNMRSRTLRTLEKKRDRVARLVHQQEKLRGNNTAATALPACLDDIDGPRTFAASFSEFMRLVDRSIGDGDYFFDSTATGAVLYLVDRIRLFSSDSLKSSKGGHALADEVTYTRFQQEFWPKYLAGGAAGMLHSGYTVYREILVIKAGRTRTESREGPRFVPLTREEYVGGRVSLEASDKLGCDDREKVGGRIFRCGFFAGWSRGTGCSRSFVRIVTDARRGHGGCCSFPW